MEFSVRDRIILTNLLPKEGNIVDLRIIRNLTDELGFDEHDLANFGMAQNETGVTWDPSKEQPKRVAIGPRAGAIIRERLEALNRANKLTADHLPLWERFVEADLEIRAVS